MAGRLSESEVAVLKLEIGNYNTRCDRTSDERVDVIMTAPAYRKRPQSRSYLANLLQIFAISYSGAARMVAKSNLPPSFRLPAVYAKCAETSSGRGHNGGATSW